MENLTALFLILFFIVLFFIGKLILDGITWFYKYVLIPGLGIISVMFMLNVVLSNNKDPVATRKMPHQTNVKPIPSQNGSARIIQKIEEDGKVLYLIEVENEKEDHNAQDLEKPEHYVNL